MRARTKIGKTESPYVLAIESFVFAIVLYGEYGELDFFVSKRKDFNLK